MKTLRLFALLDQLRLARQPVSAEILAQRLGVSLRTIYRDLAQQESRRRIWPLGLTLFDDAWLLTAWCERRGDFRNFRLDRIVRLSETGERFIPQKGRRFQDYLDRL